MSCLSFTSSPHTKLSNNFFISTFIIHMRAPSFIIIISFVFYFMFVLAAWRCIYSMHFISSIVVSYIALHFTMSIAYELRRQLCFFLQNVYHTMENAYCYRTFCFMLSFTSFASVDSLILFIRCCAVEQCVHRICVSLSFCFLLCCFIIQWLISQWVFTAAQSEVIDLSIR